MYEMVPGCFFRFESENKPLKNLLIFGLEIAFPFPVVIKLLQETAFSKMLCENACSKTYG